MMNIQNVKFKRKPKNIESSKLRKLNMLEWIICLLKLKKVW